MSRKILVINLLLITSLAIQPTIAWSWTVEEPSHGWALVMAVKPGEKLSVKLEDGRKVNGTVNSVSEAMLSLSVDNQTKDFSRQDIKEIRLARGRPLKKSILIGTLTGTGLGTGLGIAAAATDTGYANDGFLIPVGAVVGAIFGALIGLGIGFLPRQGHLIYKAEGD